jgi:hypothetical protein
VASGWTTEQIATSLNLSTKTVQNYHYQIKSKIGARTDAHLVWLATAAGLVAPDKRGLACGAQARRPAALALISPPPSGARCLLSRYRRGLLPGSPSGLERAIIVFVIDEQHADEFFADIDFGGVVLLRARHHAELLVAEHALEIGVELSDFLNVHRCLQCS